MNNRRNISNNSRNTSGNRKDSNSGEYNSTPANRFYTVKEEEKLRFYQVPKTLFNSLSYKGLSLGAKLMYSILRDRLDISIKNEWEDENGYIYLIYSLKELLDILEIYEKTAIKYKKELVKYGLIIDKRIGQGNPNRIYVLKPELSNDKEKKTDIVDNSFQNCNNYSSRAGKKTVPELKKIQSIDTNVNHPNLNNVNRASREGAVENSREEIKGERPESKGDINDIRKKIRKSLEENKKESILEENNPGENSNPENDYSGNRKMGKYFPNKRRSAEKELLAKEIAEEMADDHSLGAFRTIVDKIPQQQIRIFFSIVKDTHLTGRIKNNKGAMFISLAKAYAKKNNINLNFK